MRSRSQAHPLLLVVLLAAAAWWTAVPVASQQHELSVFPADPTALRFVVTGNVSLTDVTNGTAADSSSPSSTSIPPYVLEGRSQVSLAADSALQPLLRVLRNSVPPEVVAFRAPVDQATLLRTVSADLLPVVTIPMAGSEANASATVPACLVAALPTSRCLVTGLPYDFVAIKSAQPDAAVASASAVLPLQELPLPTLSFPVVTQSAVTIAWEPPSLPPGEQLIAYTIQIRFGFDGNGRIEEDDVELDRLLLPEPLNASNGQQVEPGPLLMVLDPATTSYELRGCYYAVGQPDQRHCVQAYTWYDVVVKAVGLRSLGTSQARVRTLPGRFPAPRLRQSSFASGNRKLLLEAVVEPTWPGRFLGLEAVVRDLYNGSVSTISTLPLVFANKNERYFFFRFFPLPPFTTYNISVAFRTEAGLSPYGSIVVTTDEEPPDPPIQVVIDASAGTTTNNSYEATWHPPHGRPKCRILGYELYVGTSARPTSVLLERINGTAALVPADLVGSGLGLRVVAVSKAGRSLPSEHATVLLPTVQRSNKDHSVSSGALAGIIIGIVAFLVLLLLAVWLRSSSQVRKWKRAGISLPPPDKWELARTNLTLRNELGSGAFGVVYRGHLVSKSSGTSGASMTEVAIKECVSDAPEAAASFLREADLMKVVSKPGHPNVVFLVGTCLQSQPMRVVMEYCNGGDLRHFLLDNRPDSETPSLMSWIDLARSMRDIAAGMDYLCNQHGFVHRDLACRNCLVESSDTDIVVKVGDLGLSRDIHYFNAYQRHGEIVAPVRWMAPESLRQGFFSQASDVWSFGVCMFEIATFGDVPYGNTPNEMISQAVAGGLRLTAPKAAPLFVEALMKQCFDQPDHRPGFKSVLEQLGQVIDGFLQPEADTDNEPVTINVDDTLQDAMAASSDHEQAPAQDADHRLLRPSGFSTSSSRSMHLNRKTTLKSTLASPIRAEEVAPYLTMVTQTSPRNNEPQASPRAPASMTCAPCDEDDQRNEYSSILLGSRQPSEPSARGKSGRSSSSTVAVAASRSAPGGAAGAQTRSDNAASQPVTITVGNGGDHPRRSGGGGGTVLLSHASFVIVACVACLLACGGSVASAAVTVSAAQQTTSASPVVVVALDPPYPSGAAVVVQPVSALRSLNDRELFSLLANTLDQLAPSVAVLQVDILTSRLAKTATNATVPTLTSYAPLVNSSTNASTFNATFAVCTPASLPVAECVLPGVNYSVTVQPPSAPGLTSSPSVYFTLPRFDVSVQQLRVTNRQPDSLTIAWDAPDVAPEIAGQITGYLVRVTFNECGDSGSRIPGQFDVEVTTEVLGASVREFTLSGCYGGRDPVANTSSAEVCVCAFSRYRLQVTTLGQLYQSAAAVDADTLPGPYDAGLFILFSAGSNVSPDALVLYVIRLSSKTGDVVGIRWELTDLLDGTVRTDSLPMPSDDTGVISPLYRTLPPTEDFTGDAFYLLRINDVEPFTRYRVRVALETEAGFGSFSTNLLQSLQAPPAAPVNFTIGDSDDPEKSVLTWGPPVGRPRGNLTGYAVFAGTEREPEQLLVYDGRGRSDVTRATVSAANAPAPLSDTKLRVRAFTEAGAGVFSDTAIDRRAVARDALGGGDSSSSYDRKVAFGVAVGLVLFVLLVALLLWLLWRRHRRLKRQLFFHLPPTDEWEVTRSHVAKGEKLGAGAFGTVYHGRATMLPACSGLPDDGKQVDVAVKECSVSSVADRHAFVHEAAVMKHVAATGRHRNVAHLLAVCMQREPMLLLLEYCNTSDLRKHLRDSRPELGSDAGSALSCLDFARFALGIARGMEFLCETAGVVHRDLSARNCLLDFHNGEFTIKVADFGLALRLEGQTQIKASITEHLPTRWMAPESFSDNCFSEKSDVWSFGIVIFEICTFGSTPYSGLYNDQVVPFVVGGGSVDTPEDADGHLIKVMRECLQHHARDRPCFSQVVVSIAAIVRSLSNNVGDCSRDSSRTYSRRSSAGGRWALQEENTKGAEETNRAAEETLAVNDSHFTTPQTDGPFFCQV